jgi:hypothetical protein
MGSNPHYGVHNSDTIHMDQNLGTKFAGKLSSGIVACAVILQNGRVDFEKWSAYKIQLHGSE